MQMPNLPQEALLTDEQILAILRQGDYTGPQSYKDYRLVEAVRLTTATSEHTWPIAYAAGQAAGWEEAAAECTTQHLKWTDLEPVLQGLVEVLDSATFSPTRIHDAVVAARRALEE